MWRSLGHWFSSIWSHMVEFLKAHTNYNVDVAFWISGGLLLLITAILSQKLSGKWKLVGWIFFVALLSFYTYTGISLNIRNNTNQKNAEDKFDTVLSISKQLLEYTKSPANNRDRKKLDAIQKRLDDLKSEKETATPPTVIQSTPMGNLKQRAIALSDEIMQMLQAEATEQPSRPQPSSTKEESQQWKEKYIKWTEDQSRHFRWKFLERAYNLNNEFAQIHLRDEQLDDFFKYINKSHPSAYTGRTYLEVDIKDVATRLRMLAEKIKDSP